MTRFLILFLCVLVAALAHAQGGITIHHDDIKAGQSGPTDQMSYQGELLNNGVPVEGPVDFIFDFWSAGLGGENFGSATILAVPVVQGRFATTIPTNFPDTGVIVFMEVSISQSQPPVYTSLGRQELIAAPFAVHADTALEANLAGQAVLADFATAAGNASNAINATNAINAINAISADSAQTAQVAVTAQAPWLKEPGKLYYFGNVGINTQNSQHSLHVVGGATGESALQVNGLGAGYAASIDSENGPALYAVNRSAAGGPAIYARLLGAAGSAVQARSEATTGDARGISATTLSPGGYAGYFLGGRNYFEGNTGIGTTDPSDKLHVSAAAGQSALRVQVDGNTKLRVTSNGGVAIGVNGSPPVDGLFVQGDIQMGERTRWLSVDGRGFSLDSSAWIEGQLVGATEQPRLYMRTAGSRTDVWISAGVQLPHGAIVSELRAYAKDDSTTTNIRVSLMRRLLATGAAGTMASVITAGNSIAIQSPSTASISQPTIDNQNYAYYLVSTWDTGLSGVEVDRTLLQGARITYTVTSPGP
jgi:hypothetical protein